jgi:hypothetical protein
MPDTFSSRRLRREARTVELLIGRYCLDHHGGLTEPCEPCRQLLAYAMKRLRHCPFQERKPTCGKCPIHCYVPDRREQIRTVMRHSGRFLLLSHPILALLHLADGLRKPRRKKGSGPLDTSG